MMAKFALLALALVAVRADDDEKKDEPVGTVIGIDQGNRITPSYVAWDTADERLVGDAAKNQATVNPETTVFDVKRLIGRKFSDKTVQHDKKLVPYKIVDKSGKPNVQVSVKGENKVYSPEEISAMILQKMKQVAE